MENETSPVRNLFWRSGCRYSQLCKPTWNQGEWQIFKKKLCCSSLIKSFLHLFPSFSSAVSLLISLYSTTCHFFFFFILYRRTLKSSLVWIMSDVAVRDNVHIQSTADVNLLGPFIQDNSALSICVPWFLRSPELCRPACRRLPRLRPDSPSPPPCCPPLNIVVLTIFFCLFWSSTHRLPFECNSPWRSGLRLSPGRCPRSTRGDICVRVDI